MAVQAQLHTNTFSPDFRARSTRTDGLQDLQMLQGRDHSILAHILLNNGATALSDRDHPKSDLTCNASAPKKRGREEDRISSMALPPHLNPNQFQYQTLPAKITATVNGNVPAIVQSRVYGSVGTSTSGRSAAFSASPDLVSHVYHQNLEIDALVRLQTERLRSELEQTRKRHCRDLLAVLEHHAVKRIKDKEIELERASRRNTELEAKVREVATESQIWFNVAKNNEAVVSGLRSTLEQVLLKNKSDVPCSDGDSDAVLFPADDAESCCFEGSNRNQTAGSEETAARRENQELRGRTACRVCKENEVCVLLLPCRHLCLCKDCEPMLDTCPVCHATKNASLQIFLS